jgi:hypothetical protein
MAMGLAGRRPGPGWPPRCRLRVEHGVVGQRVRAEGDELSGDRPVDELCTGGPAPARGGVVVSGHRLSRDRDVLGGWPRRRPPQPAELVAALRSAGAAGCNLEDTDHTTGSLRDPDRQAEWLRAVRQVASADGYRLVINARVDVFLGPFLTGAGPGTQEGLLPEALRRANAYLEVGADCVYPIALWGDRRAAPLHRGSPWPGERRTPAADTVARRAGRGRRGPRELGALPVPRRDGSLRGTAHLASEVRMGRAH